MSVILKIKKKYIAGTASFISLSIFYSYLQEIYIWLISLNKIELFFFVLFLITLVYSIFYWVNIYQNSKIVNKISDNIAKGDSYKKIKLEEHLYKKKFEEYYILNRTIKGIKLTSSWVEQENLEKETYK